MLASAVWRGARISRQLGAHKLVNALRKTKLKTVSFGSAPEKEHHERIRQEATTLMQDYTDQIERIRHDFCRSIVSA